MVEIALTALEWLRSDTWEDILPQEVDPPDGSVVTIEYTKELRTILQYFLAITEIEEISERALKLTEYLIEENPANYSAWEYRRRCVAELRKDLSLELLYTSEKASESPKNYQIWYHRRLILKAITERNALEHHKLNLDELVLNEFQYVEEVLKEDSKNYHAWAHRQWVVQKFNYFEQEMQFIDTLLEEDVRNNSAWNHRFFIFSKYVYHDDSISRKLHEEVDYALNKALLAPRNESAWNYLIGLANMQHGFRNIQGLIPQLHGIYKNGATNPDGVFKDVTTVVPFLRVLIMIFEDEITSNHGHVPEEDANLFAQLCNDLSDKLDPIRKPFWQDLKNRMLSQVL